MFGEHALLRKVKYLFLKGVKPMEKLIKFLKDEDGVTALEYTVLAALIIIVIVLFFTPIRNAVSAIWSKINSAMVSAST